MCSFIFTEKGVINTEDINFYTKFRGPDQTNTRVVHNHTFIHNLLSITGPLTSQPFIDDSGDIVCLYNGEIYNHPDLWTDKSDGECLIPLYKKYSFDFVKHLDGEFSIILFDFKKKKVLFSADTFKTKPIFYADGAGNLGCASYATPLELLGHRNVRKLSPNTAKVFDLESGMEVRTFKIYNFDLKQYKTTFEDWRTAFQKSIKKRTHGLREKVFVGLSSGYDSGAIVCELLKQHKPFKAYTVVGTEDVNVINSRKSLLNGNTEFQELFRTPAEMNEAHAHIVQKTEEFKYVTYSNSSEYNEFDLSLVADNGSNSLSLLCSQAIRDQNKILLSGSGADEIFSDYGFGGNKKYKHSNFGGLFPDDLESIFPWPSFFNSSMESYLAKEEYVAGSYGIESRYPFLDNSVVQEFLWLTSELKNRYYKSVLHNYLTYNNFPFKEGEKIGF